MFMMVLNVNTVILYLLEVNAFISVLMVVIFVFIVIMKEFLRNFVQIATKRIVDYLLKKQLNNFL
jgi:hypothetical protein